MTQRIAAVVVTFNRKALLLECLAGLLAQSRPVDRIFLIDNASTDGTREALEGAGFLSHPLIEYVPMATNTGGAGGFHHGLKVAFEAGYDWFWLMDDDVEPLPGGLADLLSFSERSGCIHGRRREADGSPNVWGETFDPRRVLTRPIADPLFTAGQESQAISVACFEGMLIAREVVERIGYPDASFFIALDDTYYGYLASRVTPVLYVNRFVLQRKRAVDFMAQAVLGRRMMLGGLAAYYLQRNRFLIARRLKSPPLPFFLATLGFVGWNLVKELFMARSPARAATVLRGVRDGLRLYFGAAA